jgi:Fic family protein
MTFNLNKLIKFDLEKDLEAKLFQDDRREQFLDFISTIREIQTVEQFIRDCPAYPKSTESIIKDELRSAVGATLAIEGTMLKDEEIEESFHKADLKKKLEKEQQEAVNTRKAYRYIIKAVDEGGDRFIYSEAHIKKIHQYLTEGIQYMSPNVPGQYRDMPAKFGEPRKISFCKSKIDIEKVMPKFITWLNEKCSGPLTSSDVVKAIMAHYYLTEIHPFGDGNGRTARALDALVLYVTNKRAYSYRSMANFWNNNRNEYILYLGNVRDTCDPWEFLIWGAKGYLDQVKRIKDLVLKKVKQLMLQDYARWLAYKKKINHRIYGVLMLIIHSGRRPLNEFLSSPELRALYSNRKTSTRYKDFNKMEKRLNLIRIFKEEDKKFIEPNFQVLEGLEYEI